MQRRQFTKEEAQAKVGKHVRSAQSFWPVPRRELPARLLNRLAVATRRSATSSLLLVWDNASWQISREVRNWIGSHNRRAKKADGVRIVVCQLPVKSPCLNHIEPHW